MAEREKVPSGGLGYMRVAGSEAQRHDKVNVLWLWDRLDSLGGVETLLLGMAKKIDASRFCLSMATFKYGYVAAYFEEAGVRVIEIPKKGKWDISAVLRIARLVRKLKMDVIHTHGHFPGFVGRLAGRLTSRKVISTYHLALNEDGHPPSTKVLTKLTLPLADFVTFVSKGVEESFYGKSSVFQIDCGNRKKHFTIYNGVDVEAIRRIADRVDRKVVRRSLGLRDDDVLILNVGRLTEQKGQKYLIMAMQEVVNILPKAKVLIFGEGELREDLEELIRSNGLVEHVRIFPPTRDIVNIMSACDIFVFPSLWESFGLALAEAMAVQMPVVASNVIGVNEIIDAGANGILLESGNIGDLAEAIVRLIKDADLRRRLATEAEKTIWDRFAMETTVGKYVALYEKPGPRLCC